MSTFTLTESIYLEALNLTLGWGQARKERMKGKKKKERELHEFIRSLKFCSKDSQEIKSCSIGNIILFQQGKLSTHFLMSENFLFLCFLAHENVRSDMQSYHSVMKTPRDNLHI